LTWINGARSEAGIFHLIQPDEDFDLPALMALVLLGPRRLLPWPLSALALFALLCRG
jgi:hypothetical protein